MFGREPGPGPNTHAHAVPPNASAPGRLRPCNPRLRERRPRRPGGQEAGCLREIGGYSRRPGPASGPERSATTGPGRALRSDSIPSMWSHCTKTEGSWQEVHSASVIGPPSASPIVPPPGTAEVVGPRLDPARGPIASPPSGTACGRCRTISAPGRSEGHSSPSSRSLAWGSRSAPPRQSVTGSHGCSAAAQAAATTARCRSAWVGTVTPW